MEELSADAYRAYRALIYETPGFEKILLGFHGDRRDRQSPYWQPAVVREKKSFASRTCGRSRGCSAGRRAASCCRVVWLRAAVKAWIAAHSDDGLPLLREMAREWPFFQTLLSNMDMVLAKAISG